MKIVFAVSEGEYSAFGVHALFASRELAEAHVAECRDAFVEEYAFFDVAPVKVTWYELRYSMYDSGKSDSDEGVFERVTWEYDAPLGISRRPHTSLLESRTERMTDYKIQYGLFGECLERAPLAKILSDTKAQWVAQGFRLHHTEPWR